MVNGIASRPLLPIKLSSSLSIPFIRAFSSITQYSTEFSNTCVLLPILVYGPMNESLM